MREICKKFYNRFISLKGEPKHIAMGFAVGVAVGFFPVIGIHTVIVMLIAFILKKHFAAMLIGSWVSCNPLTVGPVLASEFYVGKWILGGSERILSESKFAISSMFLVGRDLLSYMTLGAVIFSVPAAIFTYYFVRWSFIRIRNRKKVSDA